MRLSVLALVFISFTSLFSAHGQKIKQRPATVARVAPDVIRGADRTTEYLPLLKGKKVALVVNQTSEVNGVLLPDTLLKLGVNVVKIFSPEHGFRGNADAGARVKNGKDEQTGLPVISLYGNNKKPSAEQLKDVDVLVYDLQDVGARFYTYISTLEYLMDACAENKKSLLILDRPNPLGFIVDGPILEKSNRSFVGMQPVPVVYGMTAGEYAKMLAGEKWIKAAPVDMKVITCENYTHKTLYRLPVMPSPNLKNMAAIYLYPSMCFFEGTVLSVGRGTNYPFQQFGHPALQHYSYTFKPVSIPGATDPPLKNQQCHGKKIAETEGEALKAADGKMQIKWLLEAYQNFPDKDKFFNNFLVKLSGTETFRKQVEQGMSEDAIRKSWQPGLDKFRAIRKKYLLYGE